MTFDRITSIVASAASAAAAAAAAVVVAAAGEKIRCKLMVCRLCSKTCGHITSPQRDVKPVLPF